MDIIESINQHIIKHKADKLDKVYESLIVRDDDEEMGCGARVPDNLLAGLVTVDGKPINCSDLDEKDESDKDGDGGIPPSIMIFISDENIKRAKFRVLISLLQSYYIPIVAYKADRARNNPYYFADLRRKHKWPLLTLDVIWHGENSYLRSDICITLKDPYAAFNKILELVSFKDVVFQKKYRTFHIDLE